MPQDPRSGEEKERAFFSGRPFYLLITIVHLCWAISGPLTKMGYAGLHITGTDVFEITAYAGLRLLGAGLIGLLYCRLTGIRLLPERLGDFWPLTKLGLIMGVVQYLFFNFGAAFSSGVQTSILSSTGAFFGIFISALLFKEDTLTRRKLLGCLLGLAAVVILNWQDLRLGFTASVLGAVLLLMGQLSGSLGAAYLKIISQGRSAIWVGGWQSVISGGILLLLGLCAHGPLNFSGGGAVVPTVVLLATSGIALIISNQLYKYNHLSKVMIFSLLTPVLGVVASALMLGDSLRSASVVLSLLLNCAGIALVTTEKPAGG